MLTRPIRGVVIAGQIVLAAALLLTPGAVSVRAQRLPMESAAQAAAEKAQHPAPPNGLARPLPVSPPVSTFASAPLPSPVSTLAPPRPVMPPAVGPADVGPSRWQRLPFSPTVPSPEPAPAGKPYCSPLSAVYNTGAICFNPDLSTINPAFFHLAPSLPPPVFKAAGGPISSLVPPALLLQYCATCAMQHAGLPPPNAARGVKQPPISPPVVPSGPPMILVLKNGTTALVGRYWLGSDWLIHYVTVDGLPGAVPSGMLNLQATGKINIQRGSVFSLPGWPDP